MTCHLYKKMYDYLKALSWRCEGDEKLCLKEHCPEVMVYRPPTVFMWPSFVKFKSPMWFASGGLSVCCVSVLFN